VSRLTAIVARTRSEVARRRRLTPLDEVQAAAEDRAAAEPRRPFGDALGAPGLGVIAEHKRRSPSAGIIREDVGLPDVVRAYERGGAVAVSILTDGPSFGGSLADLGLARRCTGLPLLRKDFIVDPYQVPEAVVAGADAILLIVAALDPDVLAELYELARSLGLEALVEVHDEAELARAVALGAGVIGINNRSLATLEVDTDRTHALLSLMPGGTLVVAESGFRTRGELERLAVAGVDAVLVGEALMRAPEIEAACRELTGVAVQS
jgi:indole-3-glycerol phosphate synthase